MSQRDRRQILHRGRLLNSRNDYHSVAADSFDQLTGRKNYEALQALQAAEIVFPVNLRFLLRGETVKNLKNLFNGYSEGDAPVNGYLVRYILADDVAGKSPEGTLTLRGHLNSCLLLLESWDYDYLKPDQFWNEYYGGVASLCIKARHLVHERAVGMLIGVRGQQVDSFSDRHDCDIQILSLTLPKSNERVACIIGRIPDTVRVIRDMFLTLLAKPNDLNGLVIFYHPCNYVFEFSKRGGGIHESQAVERQRLIASRGPQHRRRSDPMNRLFMFRGSGDNSTKSRTKQLPQFHPSMDSCPIPVVTLSHEHQHCKAFSWLPGSAQIPPPVNDLTAFAQFCHPWNIPQFRVQSHQQQLSIIQQDLRPQQNTNFAMEPSVIPGPGSRHSLFLPCLPSLRTNLPSTNQTFPQSQLKMTSGSRVLPASLPYSLISSQKRAVILIEGFKDPDLCMEFQLLAKETLFQLHSDSMVRSRAGLLISESSWNLHKGSLGNLGMVHHPYSTLTCSIESSSIKKTKAHDVLQCIGDLKEWYHETAKVEEIFAVGRTLDFFSKNDGSTSANIWFSLINTPSLKDKNLRTGGKSFDVELLRELSSTVDPINLTDTASDRSSSSQLADSTDNSSADETSPKSSSSEFTKKTVQFRRSSTFQTSSVSQNFHKQVLSAHPVSVAVGSPQLPYYGQRCHLHALAQRAHWKTEPEKSQRRCITSYLGCTETFFALTSPQEAEGTFTVVELLVDHFTAGSIIGAGGESINYIRRTCRCVIFIQPQSWQSDRRRIILSGARKAVEAALTLVARNLQSRTDLAECENLTRPVHIELIEHAAHQPLSGEGVLVSRPTVEVMDRQKFSDDSGIQSEDSARSQEDEKDGDWVEVCHKSGSRKSAMTKKVSMLVVPQNLGSVNLKTGPIKSVNCETSHFGMRKFSFFFRDISLNVSTSALTGSRCQTGRIAPLNSSPVGIVSQQVLS